MKLCVLVGSVFAAVGALGLVEIERLRSEIRALRAEVTVLEWEWSELWREVSQRPELERESRVLDASFASFLEVLPPPELAIEEHLMETVQELAERERVSGPY